MINLAAALCSHVRSGEHRCLEPKGKAMIQFRLAMVLLALGGLLCGSTIVGVDTPLQASTLQPVASAELPWVKGAAATCTAGRLAARPVCTTVVATTCPWLWATPSCAAFVCGYDCTVNRTQNGLTGTVDNFTSAAAACPGVPQDACVVGVFGSACRCSNLGWTAACGTYTAHTSATCY
jgi:hypothetical protein